MRQYILHEISGRLRALGVPHQYGQGTDIAINAQFLEAKWSTGRKQIHYEALILANESEQVVTMYEKTLEMGSGHAFGMSSDSSFQTGKTLYRKVKSVQYGPDGKAYEYDLDLGAIPQLVKEAAKRAGWKFKTVIKREKALYPQALY